MDDCGGCKFCKDKTKFGGPNKLKQCCIKWRFLYRNKLQRNSPLGIGRAEKMNSTCVLILSCTATCSIAVKIMGTWQCLKTCRFHIMSQEVIHVYMYFVLYEIDNPLSDKIAKDFLKSNGIG